MGGWNRRSRSFFRASHAAWSTVRSVVFRCAGDVERFLSAADVFLLPSLYETFSLVGFEAAATGLPLVVTRVHGIGGLVRDDTAGILVDRNADSVADGLIRLARDPDLSGRLAEGARKAAQAYSWQASTTVMIDLYRTLLLEHRQAST